MLCGAVLDTPLLQSQSREGSVQLLAVVKVHGRTPGQATQRACWQTSVMADVAYDKHEFAGKNVVRTALTALGTSAVDRVCQSDLSKLEVIQADQPAVLPFPSSACNAWHLLQIDTHEGMLQAAGADLQRASRYTVRPPGAACELQGA